jgi:peptidoglycan/xylan/chitin deacetylase (PgdA/CDA1 family)
VQFVLNYEEGGENCVLHGDPGSEQFLSEIVGAAAYPARHMSMESIYEYGSRAGVWRILREFEKRGLPLTVFGVGMAIERHPDLARAFGELGHEIACHGYRWIHYQDMSPEKEAEHMRLGMEAIERVTGERPLGWYTGRDSPNTHRLVAEYGGFLYDSDYYGDDLPFWMDVEVSGGAKSCRTRSTPTTCVLRVRKASIPPITSSRTCVTLSTCSTKRATKRRRCFQSACIAGCWGARAGSARCSASSITSNSTIASG